MPVVQEEEGPPPQFWEQHVTGWMRNAWGGTASSFPSITKPTQGGHHREMELPRPCQHPAPQPFSQASSTPRPLLQGAALPKPAS